MGAKVRITEHDDNQSTLSFRDRPEGELETFYEVNGTVQIGPCDIDQRIADETFLINAGWDPEWAAFPSFVERVREAQRDA